MLLIKDSTFLKPLEERVPPRAEAIDNPPSCDLDRAVIRWDGTTSFPKGSGLPFSCLKLENVRHGRYVF